MKKHDFCIGERYKIEVPEDFLRSSKFYSFHGLDLVNNLECEVVYVSLKHVDVKVPIDDVALIVPVFFEHLTPLKSNKVCCCDILINPCSCGVFEEEMKTKGKAYNKYLKLWE